MDNNERMNYSFEPSDEETPLHTEPVYNHAPHEPREQKKGVSGKLVALLLAGALVAGAGGSVLSSVILNLNSKNAAAETMAQEDTQTTDTTGQTTAEQGSYNVVSSKLPETLTSYTGDKSLTPAQVYAMNVGAVAGISTELTTTNAWGQTAAAAASGSGFVISSDGFVVTNNHVVEDANSVTVTLYNGEEYDATIVGTDSLNDVALLKIEATGLQAVTIANASDIEVGEQVIAIGNPLGELTFTMTQGYISALDREINTDGTPINMMQTDAAINSGNSGGPLFDMNGNVVGITTAKYSGSTSSGTTIEGIGFAIPISDVMDIVYDLQEHGYVTGRPYLGVSVVDLDSNTASTYGLPVGPMVKLVNEGSCTEKAGMQQGDIITAFNDIEVTTYTELVAALNDCKAGDTVTITVYRSGASLDLTVTLDERPQDTDTTATEQTQQPQDSQQQIIIPGFGNGSYGYSYGYGG